MATKSIVSSIANILPELRARTRVTARLDVTPADDLLTMSCVFDSSLLQVSEGRLAGAVARVRMDGLELSYANWNQHLICDDDGAQQSVCFNLREGRMAVEHRQERRICHFSPEGTNALCLTSEFEGEGAGIPAVEFRAHPPEQVGRSMSRVMATIRAGSAAAAHGDKIELDGADVAVILEDLALTLLDVPTSPTAVPGQQTLHRLIDLAEAEPSVRIEDAADLLHMTRRNLHYCATRSIAVSPKRLLKAIALRKVMSAIPDAIVSRKSIGDLAFENGFENFASFSADYRRLFGERPSDTFKRYRHA